MKAELVPSNGDPPFPITRDLTVVGRREYCDVQIDFHGLSKRHCVLVKTDGLLVIRDLATTNGTKVNGQRIRWAALLPNDRVTLGGYKMRVYLGPDDSPSPSELAAQKMPATVRPSLAGPVRPSAVPRNPRLPASAAPASRNGENGNKNGKDEVFAAPSPLAVPLLSAPDLREPTWPSDDDFDIEDDSPDGEDAAPSDPEKSNGDDEVFVMDLED